MIRSLPRYIVCTILAFLGASSAILCLSTGFSISFHIPLMLLVCLISSAVCTGFVLKRKTLLILIPLVLVSGFLYLFTGVFDTIPTTVIQLVHDILTRFSSAYRNVSFAIPSVPEGPQSNTLLFCLLAVVLGLWMAWGVGYRSCMISIAGTLPFLLICVIINDTPPNALPLVLLLSVWVTMLLSKERPDDTPGMDAIRMTLTMCAVLLVLGVIGVAYPKDDTRSQDLPELVQEVLDKLPGPLQDMLDRDSTGVSSQELGADTSRTLDLTQQGTRNRTDTVMMQLSSTETGALYLRGAAKDIYTGSSWESSDEASEADSVYAQTSLGTAFGGTNQAAVQIKNLKDSATVLFAPYGYISCTSAQTILSDLRIGISERDYIVYYWPDVRSLDITTASGYVNESYDQYVQEHCLELPEDTKETLYHLALSYGYDPTMSEAETIAWVAEFIRSSGTYKLNVSRQPVNYDFAVYFLTESKEGYCVHFATAAAAMYRALGIPSRYASGYRVTVTEAGAVTDVTDQNTHAWAEVYLSGLGWIPVETTPGFGETSALPELQQEIPEEPITEAEAEPSEEPSEPSAEPTEEPVEAEPSVEPSMEPSPSAVPAQTETGETTQTVPVLERSNRKFALISVLLLVLLVLAVLIRRTIVILRRRKAFRVENRNQAVLNMWQYLERLSLWGLEIPAELEQLALKAKFSPHEITQEELMPYAAQVRQLSSALQSSLTRWKRFRFHWLSCLTL
jgi:hypothetical protein